MNMLKEHPIFWINWINLLVNSFILAVSLYPFAGKGIQGVKATDQKTPHLCGVLFLLKEQLFQVQNWRGVFFFLIKF